MIIKPENIKELKKLNANIEVTNEGLILHDDWHEKYNVYHHLFIEIKGNLIEPPSHIMFNSNFLFNLKKLNYLIIPNTVQDKNFLKNLEELNVLFISNSIQHPNFLRNLKKLNKLFTENAIQNPNFLKQITELEDLFINNSIQNKNFLKNLNKLNWLYSFYKIQNKDFLPNLKFLNVLCINKMTKNEYSKFIDRVSPKFVFYIKK